MSSSPAKEIAECSSLDVPNSVFGIDFSGAENAYKKIWVSKGTITSNILHIHESRRIADYMQKGNKHVSRDKCLIILKKLIAGEQHAAFGLDFPFSLPTLVLDNEDWDAFVRQFPERYKTPEQFRESCRNATQNKEFKRRTEKENKAPFCAYNLWLFKQTYFGIRDVLRPLAIGKKACILPVQSCEKGKPWVLEICPASTLKQEGVYIPYKGKTEVKQQSRSQILEYLSTRGVLVSSDVLEIAIENSEGDALDSVIAAFATYRALQEPEKLTTTRPAIYKREGYIFA
ncbi:MAG: hypothetical protein JXA38_02825 [Methanosarcinaceae archaeon]|nr:hypothetical protein [Methanosarcinaceae archaeon]